MRKWPSLLKSKTYQYKYDYLYQAYILAGTDRYSYQLCLSIYDYNYWHPQYIHQYLMKYENYFVAIYLVPEQKKYLCNLNPSLHEH